MPELQRSHPKHVSWPWCPLTVLQPISTGTTESQLAMRCTGCEILGWSNNTLLTQRWVIQELSSLAYFWLANDLASHTFLACFSGPYLSMQCQLYC